DTYFDVQIQEIEEPYRAFAAFQHLQGPGIYRVNLRAVLGAVNLRSFTLKFWVNAEAPHDPAGEYHANWEYIRIYNYALEPTATATTTHTMTATPTMSPEPTSTYTATLTTTSTETPALTRTLTRTVTMTSTVGEILSSTMTPTATMTPTQAIMLPQQLEIGLEGSIFMKPNQEKTISVLSAYQGQPQPNILIRFRRLYGFGTFQGLTATAVPTGPSGEAAQAIYSSNGQSWTVNVIQIDNSGLGPVRYLYLLVISEALWDLWFGQSGTQGSAAIRSIFQQTVVYEKAEAAWETGNEVLKKLQLEFLSTESPPTALPTATPTATATSTPTPWLEANHLLVYPNPAQDRVYFAYTVTGHINVSIDVYCLTGDRVAHIEEQNHNRQNQTQSTIWYTGNTAPGIYWARIIIKNEEGRVLVNRIVKLALLR
ncbi:T9SS type A sorting domain-containing protein, partial [candidate division FCPU426 bacterium]|nr:T9SS type A sorting domain-containing protein [candidate division FCPU426 bacterium]